MRQDQGQSNVKVKRVPLSAIGNKGIWFIYLFFAVHMAGFGATGFLLAYGNSGPPITTQFMFGGFAILVYLTFYVSIFGRDAIKWMFINAALGILGIYSQIGWILGKFGRNIHDFPWQAHVVPFTYYVLYTFLLRQFLIDLTHCREKDEVRKWVNVAYVTVSLLVYGQMMLVSK